MDYLTSDEINAIVTVLFGLMFLACMMAIAVWRIVDIVYNSILKIRDDLARKFKKNKGSTTI